MEIFTTSHIRKNILTGEEVLVSPHRTKRPWQGKVEDEIEPITISYDENCYLCPGNTRANNEVNPNYTSTFVFKNDYAALKEDVKDLKYSNGLLEAKSEQGICKVVCFSPDHSLTLSKMEVKDIEEVVHTWQHEFKTLAELSYVNNIQIFENRGEIMGCSNPHPHGQIWAQNSIPLVIQRKTENFKNYYKQHQQTLLEAYIQQELELDERVVYANDSFILVVPFWAVWPFETMIIPRKASSNILHMTTKEITDFATIIKRATSIYDKVFNVSFPYSSGIHQAPVNNETNLGWHWHMSFFPPLLRSATVKKFMVGYEMFATPQRDITAEKAAEMLKEINTKLQ
ncbi:UDP-glucose--hexose-1-phosphate uridylyltransferase [Tenacibaculum agarivorans]|uniref:UDP-glucose--hexose-1-phosphate uridylyltransferase n=1 Tax=Tenacibaculum agarivorans TaxID=1908389 RepID=UPI00094B98D2|nr:UDP-glucose--hexose-1-phosphate uridylyltransferase [Tenacibaculum agarivorans]